MHYPPFNLCSRSTLALKNISKKFRRNPIFWQLICTTCFAFGLTEQFCSNLEHSRASWGLLMKRGDCLLNQNQIKIPVLLKRLSSHICSQHGDLRLLVDETTENRSEGWKALPCIRNQMFLFHRTLYALRPQSIVMVLWTFCEKSERMAPQDNERGRDLQSGFESMAFAFS